MRERYICLYCTRQWLFIRFHLFQSHSILAHPPAPVYSFIFHSRSMSLRHGSFLSTRDENMPVQAAIEWWPWCWDSPITTTYVICIPSCVCDVCVYEYASTKIYRALATMPARGVLNINLLHPVCEDIQSFHSLVLCWAHYHPRA